MMNKNKGLMNKLLKLHEWYLIDEDQTNDNQGAY